MGSIATASYGGITVEIAPNAGVGITEPNVHVLDPFTGTGSFIVRLLQGGNGGERGA